MARSSDPFSGSGPCGSENHISPKIIWGFQVPDREKLSKTESLSIEEAGNSEGMVPQSVNLARSEPFTV